MASDDVQSALGALKEDRLTQAIRNAVQYQPVEVSAAPTPNYDLNNLGQYFQYTPVQSQGQPAAPMQQPPPRYQNQSLQAPRPVPTQEPGKIVYKGKTYSANNPILSMFPTNPYFKPTAQVMMRAQEWENQNAVNQAILARQQQADEANFFTVTPELINSLPQESIYRNTLQPGQRAPISLLPNFQKRLDAATLTTEDLLDEDYKRLRNKKMLKDLNDNGQDGDLLDDEYKRLRNKKLLKDLSDDDSKPASGELTKGELNFIKRIDTDYDDYANSVKANNQNADQKNKKPVLGKLEWMRQHPTYRTRVRDYMYLTSDKDAKFKDSSRTTYGLLNNQNESDVEADRYLKKSKLGSLTKTIDKAINDPNVDEKVVNALLRRYSKVNKKKKPLRLRDWLDGKR